MHRVVKAGTFMPPGARSNEARDVPDCRRRLRQEGCDLEHMRGVRPQFQFDIDPDPMGLVRGAHRSRCALPHGDRPDGCVRIRRLLALDERGTLYLLRATPEKFDKLDERKHLVDA